MVRKKDSVLASDKKERLDLYMPAELKAELKLLSEQSRKEGPYYSMTQLAVACIADGCERLASAVENQPTSSSEETKQLTAALYKMIDEVCKVRTELRKIGNNYNQMVRVANKTGEVPEDLGSIAEELRNLDSWMLTVGETLAAFSVGDAW